MTPHKIQLQEYSKSSVLGWFAAYLMVLHVDGNRLNLGDFDSNGLNCDNWNQDDDRNSNLGCFPLMVCRKIEAGGNFRLLL
jgi:hypothetical protein